MGFRKGQSGNPGGRLSAASRALRQLLDEVVTEDDRRAVARQLVNLARGGDMAAITLLLAYLYGKPSERLTVDHTPVRVEFAWADDSGPVIDVGQVAPALLEDGGDLPSLDD